MARPAVKRQAVDYVVDHYATSRRRACRVVCQHRGVHYYRSRKDPKTALRARMRELAQVLIRCSEFSGRVFDLWAYHRRAAIDFNRPGKPSDNCFVETLNGSLRDECLNVHWFETIDEARAKIEAWRVEYNESRPHQALNDLTPAEYA